MNPVVENGVVIKNHGNNLMKINYYHLIAKMVKLLYYGVMTPFLTTG